MHPPIVAGSVRGDLAVENVRAVFFDSLALEGEQVPATRVRGVVNEYAFNDGRLESHRGAVRRFLSHASTSFYADRGGGHSYRQLGRRRDGREWADLEDVERLLALGLGLGLIEFCFQRSRWDLFPQGVPYVRLQSDLFRLWAIFRRRFAELEITDLDPPVVFSLSFDAAAYPAPGTRDSDDLARERRERAWYKPAVFKVADLSASPMHVAEAFYNSIIVDCFFDDSLPSWVLDPETTLRVY